MKPSTHTLTLAAFGLLVVATPAFAHAHLKAAMPAADSIVTTAPRELDLTFSEGVNLPFTGVALSGPGNAAVATGAAAHGAGGNRTLVVPVTGPLAAGRYTVDWHALAADGHKTSGRYGFTVKP